MVKQAAVGTDTAVFVIARNAGEGSDRSLEPKVIQGINGYDQDPVEIEVGDYYLLPRNMKTCGSLPSTSETWS